MTTPIETMEWLDLQFRARANDDGETHTAQDAVRVAAARSAFSGMLAALAEAEWLIDNAISTHIYGDDDEVPADCSYTAGLAQIKGAIAVAGGASRAPLALDALTRIVGERIFGDGTVACEQRIIDLCIDAQKVHGITRETWARVLAEAPAAAAEAKPRFVIVIQEGAVTDVVSDDPTMIGADFAIIGHDTEGMGPDDDLVMIPQAEGEPREAYLTEHQVSQATFQVGPASIYEPASDPDGWEG